MVTWSADNDDYANTYFGIDFRAEPHRYVIGRGEQGVLMAEPYKSEILAIGWRFKTPEIAEESSSKILQQFYAYLDADDFVGADMARKFLQMGFTRSRRYANHATGRKYDKTTRELLPREVDHLTSAKAESARIFKARYDEARTDERYLRMKTDHKKRTAT